MKKIVFFDIDDTLIDHTGAQNRSLLTIRKSYFPNIAQTDFDSIWAEKTRKFWKLFVEKKLTFKEQQFRRVQTIWEHFEKDVKEEDANKIFSMYLNLYESNWSLFSGIKKSLQILRKKGIRLGIISNGNRAQQDKKLKQTGIYQLLDTKLIIVSEEVGFAKPDLKIFEHAQKISGLSHDEILFFGNDILQDIEPAQEMNWEAVLVDSPKKIINWISKNFR